MVGNNSKEFSTIFFQTETKGEKECNVGEMEGGGGRVVPKLLVEGKGA